MLWKLVMPNSLSSWKIWLKASAPEYSTVGR